MAHIRKRGGRAAGEVPAGAAGSPTVEYETGWGERVRLVICADTYEDGGALALIALDATDPDDEGHLDIWDVLTVSLPDDPAAAAWCSGRGRVVVDANNVPAALVGALAGAGVEPAPCGFPLLGLGARHVALAAHMRCRAGGARRSGPRQAGPSARLPAGLPLAARPRNAPHGSPSGAAPLTPPAARERLHSMAQRFAIIPPCRAPRALALASLDGSPWVAIAAHPLTSSMQGTVLARYGFVRTTVVPPVSQPNHLAPLLPSRGRGAPLATARSRLRLQSACCRLPRADCLDALWRATGGITGSARHPSHRRQDVRIRGQELSPFVCCRGRTALFSPSGFLPLRASIR